MRPYTLCESDQNIATVQTVATNGRVITRDEYCFDNSIRVIVQLEVSTTMLC